jgi:hypothetical protein
MMVMGYGVYARYFLTRVAIGDLCESNAMCPGQCLSMGGLNQYSKGEVCTQSCDLNSDCPRTTVCTDVTVTVVDPHKGASQEQRRFCLRQSQ